MRSDIGYVTDLNVPNFDEDVAEAQLLYRQDKTRFMPIKLTLRKRLMMKLKRCMRWMKSQQHKMK